MSQAGVDSWVLRLGPLGCPSLLAEPKGKPRNPVWGGPGQGRKKGGKRRQVGVGAFLLPFGFLCKGLRTGIWGTLQGMKSTASCPGGSRFPKDDQNVHRARHILIRGKVCFFFAGVAEGAHGLQEEELVGYGSKSNHQELDRRFFGPCFHLPGTHFRYLFLTHARLFCLFAKIALFWVWLKIQQEGQTAGMFPLIRVPFWYRFVEPQPFSNRGYV